MLSVAVLGFAIYGVYSTGLGLVDLFGVYGLDWWADLGLVALGLVLTLSAAFVRVLIPGGLALAAGALLALQALSFHNDVHFYGRLLILPQVVRGVVAAGLLALAYEGARRATRAAEAEIEETGN
jgi:hypothetical protein